MCWLLPDPTKSSSLTSSATLDTDGWLARCVHHLCRGYFVPFRSLSLVGAVWVELQVLCQEGEESTMKIFI